MFSKMQESDLFSEKDKLTGKNNITWLSLSPNNERHRWEIPRCIFDIRANWFRFRYRRSSNSFF